MTRPTAVSRMLAAAGRMFMAQQPNIELDESDLPRRELEPAAPARWQPSRPGEIESPEEMRWGGAFGRPGPDTGWAERLFELMEIEVPRGERLEDVRGLVTSIAAARASLLGRAPIPEDIEVGLMLLGLLSKGFPDATIDELADSRRRWVRRSAHERVKGKALLAALPTEVLTLKPLDLRHRLVVESQRP